MLHSRWFRRGSDFRGRSVLVVGSFASGYDVARMIAAQNYESDSGQLTPGEKDYHTKVYQSSTKGDVRGAHAQPWDRYIDSRPVISQIEPAEGEGKGVIHFSDGTCISDVDTIIYATGYYLSYPFLKVADRPWSNPAFRVVEDVIDAVEASPKDQGGLKALSVSALDGLFLFLERDRTIAFLGLRKCQGQVNEMLTSSFLNHTLPLFRDAGSLDVLDMGRAASQPTEVIHTSTQRKPCGSAAQVPALPGCGARLAF